MQRIWETTCSMPAVAALPAADGAQRGRAVVAQILRHFGLPTGLADLKAARALPLPVEDPACHWGAAPTRRSDCM
jgi:hypothetical protein